MGAFYNSIAALGRHPEVVARLLERWLAVRGFELSREPVLFDLDGESERSAFLVSNHSWTIVFYSHYEEELRLIQELYALATPLLYVWVHDSDVWGYDLFHEGDFAGSYNSDPWSHRSFALACLDEGERPQADPERLGEILGVEGLAAALPRIEKLRGFYPEDLCRKFCRLIGAEGALASYDELEGGTVQAPEGWRIRQLLFVRKSSSSPRPVDLHAHEITRWRPDLGMEPATGEMEIPSDLIAELRRMRRRRRLFMLTLKPVSWLARAGSRLRLGRRREQAPGSEGGAPVEREPPGVARAEGRRLINQRHGCRMDLPPGAEPTEVSHKPSSVFAFRIGAVTVTCTSRRLVQIDEVLRRPTRSRILEDRKFQVGPLPARRIFFDLPARFTSGSDQRSCLALYVLQTELALYVFLFRCPGRPPGELVRTIEGAVGSFSLLDP